MLNWQDKARALSAELDALGVLDPAWRAAFEDVPRHLFVPSFYRNDNSFVDGTHPEMHAEWLSAVYSDESLVTQQIAIPDTDSLRPTSSSTKPSLMSRMLGMLDVADGHTVMEIGTGTGYNAALLSHRLGGDRVASIDIDPALVEQARVRLKEAGFNPFLTAGDGAHGIRSRAPFDRVIATCAVPAIPPPWVDQLADQGIIVTDVRAETFSALVTATKIAPDVVQGRFHSTPGHFMWLRADAGNPQRDGGKRDFVFNIDDARRSVTTFDPAILRDHDFGFVLALCMPDITMSNGLINTDVYVVRTGDGSWAEVDATTRVTTQNGARSVWDEVRAAARRWAELGRPERSRFGLTVTSSGEQHIWLDRPDNVFTG